MLDDPAVGRGSRRSSCSPPSLRIVLARRIVAPWIMVDELIYSELAKSFAANGHFLRARRVASTGYGFVYPMLIAPAWRLFELRAAGVRGREGDQLGA